MLITVAGMIGGGKSSLTQIITEAFGGVAFYENADSPILQKFYTASPEELEAKRYPFLLQLEFLNSRFKMIKKCLIEGDNPKVNTLDRSIYEDAYFMEVNRQLGRISDDEATIYLNLLDNMLEELEELPKKSPDLLIYLKGSYETFKHRIEHRGRSFEAIDEETDAYFRKLWEGYDTWVEEHYKASPVLVIDIDEWDYVNDPNHRATVLERIESELRYLNLIEDPKPKDSVTVKGVYEFETLFVVEEGDNLLPKEDIIDNLEEDFVYALRCDTRLSLDAKITKLDVIVH